MPSILAIDDDPKMRKALNHLFRTKGFQVAAVPNGVDAAKLMRLEVPDLVLIDQNVPMGGIKTAQILRLHARYQQIPLLLGLKPGAPDHTREILKTAMAQGISWVIARPYKPDHLIGKVNESLEKKGKIQRHLKQKAEGITDVEIRQRVRELTDLPTLSPTQQRIINILSHDDADVNMDELIDVIQSDQSLTMRTLKIARSAGYGFQGNLLPSAITFLGIQKMRQIVQSATIMDIFGDSENTVEQIGLDPNGFWMHSIACGMVMQLISRDNFKSKHYMAGLLHDIGKLVLALKFSPYSRAINELAQKECRSREQIEQELIGITHSEIGYEIARQWDLPAELAESIYHHHAPNGATRHKMLTSLVYISNIAVRQMGIGASGNYVPPEVEDPFAQKVRLSMPLHDVVAQREQFVSQIESIVNAN